MPDLLRLVSGRLYEQTDPADWVTLVTGRIYESSASSLALGLVAGRRMMIDACACGSPIPTFVAGAAVSADDQGCPTGTTWTISWTLSATPAWAALEVWRCTTNGCSNFAFWKRLAIGTGSTTDTRPDSYSSAGGGDPATFYGTYKVRIVPACSANGAGPFCRDDTSSQYTDSYNDCRL